MVRTSQGTYSLKGNDGKTYSLTSTTVNVAAPSATR
jgi:hypothetical protein